MFIMMMMMMMMMIINFYYFINLNKNRVQSYSICGTIHRSAGWMSGGDFLKICANKRISYRSAFLPTDRQDIIIKKYNNHKNHINT